MYPLMLGWLNMGKRRESGQMALGHSEQYATGYMSAFEDVLDFCHNVLDGDMVRLRRDTLQNARRELERFEEMVKTLEFQKGNKSVSDHLCMFRTLYGERCENEDSNGYRWCLEHKDNWCEVCGKHATHACGKEFESLPQYCPDHTLLCDDCECPAEHYRIFA